ncbi:MAG: hypothetical protein QXL96_11115 [Ignisphaera sp.]
MKNVCLLGSVDIITKAKLILVRIEKPENVPIVGSKVVDANGVEVGKIVDVIGPISKPYAVVKPVSYAVLSLIKPSTVLFYRTVKEKKYSRKGAKK